MWSIAANRVVSPLVRITPEVLIAMQVTGCSGHNVDSEKKAMLRDPKTFSMSNIRDVTTRMVSGFFYASPHSPTCARNDKVVSDAHRDAPVLFRIPRVIFSKEGCWILLVCCAYISHMSWV